MTMIETANKFASDELHKIQLREIAELRRENARLRARLMADDTDIEIHSGRMVFLRGNDPGGNMPELPAGKISEKADTNSRRP